MITYSDFILKYPGYGNLPYDQADIKEKIDTTLADFPAIEECLPEGVKLLGLLYGVKMLFDEDDESCYGGKRIKSIKSLDDMITYQTNSDNVYGLRNSRYGEKLSRLFETYGCYLTISKPEIDPCNCLQSNNSFSNFYVY